MTEALHQQREQSKAALLLAGFRDELSGLRKAIGKGKDLGPAKLEKQTDYESIIPKDRLNKIVNKLRQSAIKKIPQEIAKHYNNKFNYDEKITSHDHEILALGSKASFDIENYLKLLSKTGDSIYYSEYPKLSWEDYAGKKYSDFQPEIATDEKLEELKLDFEKEKNLSFKDFSESHRYGNISADELKLKYEKNKNRSFEDYLRARDYITRDTAKSNYEKLKSGYEEYLKVKHSETREFHVGSTAYALLRSGTYDAWIKEGGTKAQLAKKIIEDINNPRHYKCDPTTCDDNAVMIGNAGNMVPDRAHEVEWITATWIELEKRGVKPVFDRGGQGSPFTLEELNTINQRRLDFTLDKDDKETKLKKFNTSEDFSFQTHNAACDGTHALDALVMYDVYKKDSLKLHEHLDIATKMLEKTLIKTETLNDSSKKSEYDDVLHDFAHELLPFTELTNDFIFEAKMKATVQLSIKKMVEVAEYVEGNSGDDLKVGTMAHMIDTLKHLPKCVLEKTPGLIIQN